MTCPAKSLLASLCAMSMCGCATTVDTQTVAAADCKVYLREAGSLPSGRRAPDNDRLERQYAISSLSTSELRWRMQTRVGPTGLIEETLRNCER